MKSLPELRHDLEKTKPRRNEAICPSNNKPVTAGSTIY